MMTACHAHFAIFSFLILLNIHFSLKLFLICSYFSGDLSLTVLIKCALNKKKVYLIFEVKITLNPGEGAGVTPIRKLYRDVPLLRV